MSLGENIFSSYTNRYRKDATGPVEQAEHLIARLVAEMLP
jgi:hypothetical protein